MDRKASGAAPRPGTVAAVHGLDYDAATARLREWSRFSADLNRTVRSVLTPPRGAYFKPTPLVASSKPLHFFGFDFRTKTAVVRLRRRKWCERDGKRPQMGLLAGPRGSEEWPRRPAFCAIPAVAWVPKKTVPSEETGGASGIRNIGLHLSAPLIDYPLRQRACPVSP
jgi:hypothetical protein